MGVCTAGMHPWWQLAVVQSCWYQCLDPSSACHAACPALQKPEAGEQPADKAAASTAAPAAAAPGKSSGGSGGKKGKGKH